LILKFPFSPGFEPRNAKAEAEAVGGPDVRPVVRDLLDLATIFGTGIDFTKLYFGRKNSEIFYPQIWDIFPHRKKT
jgi:hypothetical protein